MYVTDHNDYLMHHGIKGQKWGVRRFQNEDGTLTENGKKRYNSGNGSVKKKKTPESKTWRPEEYGELSDEELNRRNSRLQRERQYKDMTTPQWKKTAKDIARKVLLTTAVGALSGYMAVKYKDTVIPWIKNQSHTLMSTVKSAFSQNAKPAPGPSNMDEIRKRILLP